MGDSPETRRTKLNIESQESENQKSRDFQHAENDIDREFQRQTWNEQFEKMNQEWDRRFEVENEYNQPQAQVARLIAAGINPAALVSQLTGTTGTMSPAAPSAPSSPAGGHGIGFGSITPTAISTDAALFSSIAQLNDSLSKSVQTGLNVNEQRQMLGARVKNVLADTAQKESVTTYQEIRNGIEAIFGKDRAGKEINKLVSDAELASAQGRSEDAKALLIRAQEALAKQEKAQNDKKFPEVLENLKKQGRVLDEEAKTEQTKQEENRASASYYKEGAAKYHEEAESEKVFRPVREILLKSQNASEEEKKKVLSEQLRKIRTDVQKENIEKMLLEIKLRDTQAYSAIHRILFGPNHEKGDLDKALKFFEAPDFIPKFGATSRW